MKRKSSNPRERRHRRVRAKIAGTALRPRLSVFRSHKHVWAQLINDGAGTTLAAASDMTDNRTTQKKTDRAAAAGKMIAEKAIASGIKRVVFDRSRYKYHGRVKALAEGAREAGLQF